MKIKAIIETGYATCNYEDEFEVSDDITEQEINEMIDEWVNDHISVNWWKEE